MFLGKPYISNDEFRIFKLLHIYKRAKVAPDAY